MRLISQCRNRSAIAVVVWVSFGIVVEIKLRFDTSAWAQYPPVWWSLNCKGVFEQRSLMASGIHNLHIPTAHSLIACPLVMILISSCACSFPLPHRQPVPCICAHYWLPVELGFVKKPFVRIKPVILVHWLLGWFLCCHSPLVVTFRSLIWRIWSRGFIIMTGGQLKPGCPWALNSNNKYVYRDRKDKQWQV